MWSAGRFMAFLWASVEPVEREIKVALGKKYAVSKVVRLKICHWFLMVSQIMLPFYQIFRIVKAHKEILFKFFFIFFFLLGHPFDEIILCLKNLCIFL